MNDSDGKTVVPFTNGVTVETLSAKSEAEVIERLASLPPLEYAARADWAPPRI